MAFTNLADFVTKRAAPQQSVGINKQSLLSAAIIPFTHHSLWLASGNPAAGVAPTAAAVCDNTTLGAVQQANASTGSLYALLRRLMVAYPGLALPYSGYLTICDRLVHCAGLDGTLTTPQTVSTPALTRSTTGVGVIAALELYSTFAGDGSVAATATLDYTNTAGTTGKTTPATPTPGGASARAGRLVPFSLDAADSGKGVQAVNTLTLAGAFASTGNVGVTLYKPLMQIPFFFGFPSTLDPLLESGFFLPTIPASACLFFVLSLPYNVANIIFTVTAGIDLIEA